MAGGVLSFQFSLLFKDWLASALRLSWDLISVVEAKFCMNRLNAIIPQWVRTARFTTLIV